MRTTGSTYVPHAIPVAALAAAFDVPEPSVTPEEAAAIARRIRVEARLPRVTLIGAILGLVCGVAAIWPFLDSAGYMGDAIAGGNVLGLMTFLPGWLLAGLLPLLAFYAGRLHFQTGRSSTGDVEASLRKIRQVILWSMFASMTAFTLILAQQRDRRLETPLWLPSMYLASFAACVAIVGDVRRGLGDFDSEQQRRRRKLARGFTVELRSASEQVMSAPAPLPLPAQQAMPVSSPLPVDLTDDDEDDHFNDLRLFMTLAILIAAVLYAVRVSEYLVYAIRASDWVVNLAEELFEGRLPLGEHPLAGVLTLFDALAMLLLTPCGVLWVIWAVLALNYGPGFRRTVNWLTAVTLVLAVVVALPGLIYGTKYHDPIQGGGAAFVDGLIRAPEIIHCLFLGLLLRRPGAKRLFARSDEI